MWNAEAPSFPLRKNVYTQTDAREHLAQRTRGASSRSIIWRICIVFFLGSPTQFSWFYKNVRKKQQQEQKHVWEICSSSRRPTADVEKFVLLSSLVWEQFSMYQQNIRLYFKSVLCMYVGIHMYVCTEIHTQMFWNLKLSASARFIYFDIC